MLAGHVAHVVGVEPGRSLHSCAVAKAAEQRPGIRYVRADREGAEACARPPNFLAVAAERG